MERIYNTPKVFSFDHTFHEASSIRHYRLLMRYTNACVYVYVSCRLYLPNVFTFCNQLSNCNLLLGKYTSKTIYGIVSLKTTILKVIYPRFSSHDADQIFYYMLGGQMRITNASIRKYLKLEISGNFYP